MSNPDITDRTIIRFTEPPKRIKIYRRLHNTGFPTYFCPNISETEDFNWDTMFSTIRAIHPVGVISGPFEIATHDGVFYYDVTSDASPPEPAKPPVDQQDFRTECIALAAERTWSEAYPTRRPWSDVHPKTKAEWIRTFTLFLKHIEAMPSPPPAPDDAPQQPVPDGRADMEGGPTAVVPPLPEQIAIEVPPLDCSREDFRRFVDSLKGGERVIEMVGSSVVPKGWKGTVKIVDYRVDVEWDSAPGMWGVETGLTKGARLLVERDAPKPSTEPDRKDVLLRAAFDLMKRCPHAEETLTHYDGSNCDGNCLMHDIANELGFHFDADTIPLASEKE